MKTPKTNMAELARIRNAIRGSIQANKNSIAMLRKDNERLKVALTAINGGKKKMGFAVMPKEKRKAIQSKGVKALAKARKKTLTIKTSHS